MLTENKSKRELIRMLVQKGFESDPVAAWSKAQEKVGHIHTFTFHTLHKATAWAEGIVFTLVNRRTELMEQ